MPFVKLLFGSLRRATLVIVVALNFVMAAANAAPGDNVALSSNGGTAAMNEAFSSSFPASECINDITTVSGDMCHTRGGDYPWVDITLQQSTSIDYIKIFNRVGCCNERADNLWVMVSETPFPPATTSASLTSSQNQSVYIAQITATTTSTYTFDVGDLFGRYIRVQRPGTPPTPVNQNFINLAEIQVIEAFEKIDLALQKSVSNPTPKIGDTVTFTLEVSNSGPNDAINFLISDVLPSGFGQPANISNGGTANASNELAWTIPSLANGASMSVTFDVVVR